MISHQKTEQSGLFGAPCLKTCASERIFDTFRQVEANRLRPIVGALETMEFRNFCPNLVKNCVNFLHISNNNCSHFRGNHRITEPLFSPNPPHSPKNRINSRALRRKGGKKNLRLVPKVGVEPTRPCERGILNPLRLPFRHSGTPPLYPSRKATSTPFAPGFCWIPNKL